MATILIKIVAEFDDICKSIRMLHVKPSHGQRVKPLLALRVKLADAYETSRCANVPLLTIRHQLEVWQSLALITPFKHNGGLVQAEGHMLPEYLVLGSYDRWIEYTNTIRLIQALPVCEGK